MLGRPPEIEIFLVFLKSRYEMYTILITLPHITHMTHRDNINRFINFT